MGTLLICPIAFTRRFTSLSRIFLKIWLVTWLPNRLRSKADFSSPFLSAKISYPTAHLLGRRGRVVFGSCVLLGARRLMQPISDDESRLLRVALDHRSHL